MSRTVFCSRNKKEMPGLDRQPMPGPLGKEVFEKLSREAWQEWTGLQTILINENKLNLMEPKNREYLGEKLKEFINGEAVSKPVEYTEVK